jgi:hypothetical protein
MPRLMPLHRTFGIDGVASDGPVDLTTSGLARMTQSVLSCKSYIGHTVALLLYTAALQFGYGPQEPR